MDRLEVVDRGLAFARHAFLTRAVAVTEQPDRHIYAGLVVVVEVVVVVLAAFVQRGWRDGRLPAVAVQLLDQLIGNAQRPLRDRYAAIHREDKQRLAHLLAMQTGRETNLDVFTQRLLDAFGRQTAEDANDAVGEGQAGPVQEPAPEQRRHEVAALALALRSKQLL